MESELLQKYHFKLADMFCRFWNKCRLSYALLLSKATNRNKNYAIAERTNEQ